jgi:hypothetical protein
MSNRRIVIDCFLLGLVVAGVAVVGVLLIVIVNSGH